MWIETNNDYLIHLSNIDVISLDGRYIYYGSNENLIEEFDSENEALARYNFLKNKLGIIRHPSHKLKTGIKDKNDREILVGDTYKWRNQIGKVYFDEEIKMYCFGEGYGLTACGDGEVVID